MAVEQRGQGSAASSCPASQRLVSRRTSKTLVEAPNLSCTQIFSNVSSALAFSESPYPLRWFCLCSFVFLLHSFVFL